MRTAPNYHRRADLRAVVAAVVDGDDALAGEPAADEDDLEDGADDVDDGLEEAALDHGVVLGVVEGLVVREAAPLARP